MAIAWQKRENTGLEHGNDMAMTGRAHGNDMAMTWQGKKTRDLSMAMTWQENIALR